jgi:hypothetical protein
MSKMYSLTFRNRTVAMLFLLLALGLGVIFVTVGFALLAALAVGGTVIGTGVAMYHRLRRGSHVETDQRLSARQGLDPSLEISPERPAIVRSREDSDE